MTLFTLHSTPFNTEYTTQVGQTRLNLAVSSMQKSRIGIKASRDVDHYKRNITAVFCQKILFYRKKGGISAAHSPRLTAKKNLL